MRWRLLAASVAVLAAAAGGGCTSAPRRVAGGNAALAEWRRFPVTEQPRPLVLLAGRVADPPGGFRSNDDKLAFMAGAVSDPPSLPLAPSTADGYPVSSAADALRTLRVGHATPATQSLRTRDVRLGAATFSTDRGRLTLPAWLFSFDGVSNPAAVLAVAGPAVFEPAVATDRPAGFSAQLDGVDGRRLHLRFVGGPESGRCSADYHATVEQSASAVAVAITAVPHAGTGPAGACDAMGYPRDLPIQLSSQLGPRVLVDATTGAAAEVTIANGP